MKSLYFLLCLVILFTISACKNDVEDYVLDISIEDYRLIYSNDDYSIFELREYDKSTISYTSIEMSDDLICYISDMVDNQYVLEYNESYLHINYGIRNDLYDARDLYDNGVDIECDLINNGEPEDTPSSKLVGTIQGIEFYRDTAPVCDMELGQVTIDGFDFGYISAGCDYTLNSIGYVAYTSNKVYRLEEVMLSGRVTVEDIHDLYMSDEDRRGTFD